MHENVQQKTEKSRTDPAKVKKSLKYDFSHTNWREATGRWLKGVKARCPKLFPEISKQARIMAGIKVKPDAETESSIFESGSDSGRDLDSDYGNTGSDDNNQDNAGSDADMDAGNHQGIISGYNELEDNGGANEADNEREDDDGGDGHNKIEGSDDEGPRVEGSGHNDGVQPEDVIQVDGGFDGSASRDEVGDDDYEMILVAPEAPEPSSDLSDLSAD
jgi:hypothetical protein